MKYTNYLINGNFIDIDSIIAQNKILRTITIPIGIVVAFTGVICIGGIIPMAVMADTGRSIKYAYYTLMKKYYMHKYYDNVFNSLSVRHMQKVRMQIALKDINIFEKEKVMHILLYPDLLFIQGVRNLKDIRKKIFNF
jgi:hypothetical protein